MIIRIEILQNNPGSTSKDAIERIRRILENQDNRDYLNRIGIVWLSDTSATLIESGDN